MILSGSYFSQRRLVMSIMWTHASSYLKNWATVDVPSISYNCGSTKPLEELLERLKPNRVPIELRKLRCWGSDDLLSSRSVTAEPVGDEKGT